MRAGRIERVEERWVETAYTPLLSVALSEREREREREGEAWREKGVL